MVYNGKTVAMLHESALSDFKEVLTEGDDYTIAGTVITLTDSGYNKVPSDMPPVPVEG